MDKQKYDEIDETFKCGVLMTFGGTLLAVIILFILIVTHKAIWDGQVHFIDSYNDLIIFIVEPVILSLLHEFIHSVTYIKLGKLTKESVKFKAHFPISISVHYTEIVPIDVRKWSTIMPTLIICPIILIIGLFTNSLMQTVISGILFAGGITDILNFIRLGIYKSDCMVEDKPCLAGCIVYKPKE